MKVVKETYDGAVVLTLKGEFDSFVTGAFSTEIESVDDAEIESVDDTKQEEAKAETAEEVEEPAPTSKRVSAAPMSTRPAHKDVVLKEAHARRKK